MRTVNLSARQISEWNIRQILRWRVNRLYKESRNLEQWLLENVPGKLQRKANPWYIKQRVDEKLSLVVEDTITVFFLPSIQRYQKTGEFRIPENEAFVAMIRDKEGGWKGGDAEQKESLMSTFYETFVYFVARQGRMELVDWMEAIIELSNAKKWNIPTFLEKEDSYQQVVRKILPTPRDWDENNRVFCDDMFSHAAKVADGFRWDLFVKRGWRWLYRILSPLVNRRIVKSREETEELLRPYFERYFKIRGETIYGWDYTSASKEPGPD